jgi:hypothetical protein
MSIDTHGMLVEFGKHRGQRWTRVPVSYLRWIANLAPPHKSREIAVAELERRNIPLVNCEIEITGHAIDSASLRLRKTWHAMKNENEGLHSWLQRMCTDALGEYEPDSEGRIHWHGIQLVFEEGAIVPILKTCMPVKTGRQSSTDSDSPSIPDAD